VNKTLADDLAAAPDVAEGEERGSREGLEGDCQGLEGDWRMTEGLRGPSSALGDEGFLIWSLENRSELPVAAGLDGDLGSSACPGVTIAETA
jgi:hypothetical protein